MLPLRFARYRDKLALTHYLFRFPAKFHPPAVRCLIDRYSSRGDVILDPFCGSGTLLVEALLMGRPAVGIDVDPIAAFISRVKSRPISTNRLEDGFSVLRDATRRIRRPATEYDRLMHEDLAEGTIARFRRRLEIPPIPNIDHWFRQYVANDLARLRWAIVSAGLSPEVERFFLACFAAIIRNASNADPVPVSGLEVTAHIRRLDERGRRIDPFELFEQKVLRQIKGMAELCRHASDVPVKVRRGDATRLDRLIAPGCVDVVITSPPYNTAVDYYRRHTLEMYWLGFVASREERIRLGHSYLGRAQIRRDSRRLRWMNQNSYVRRLIKGAEAISAARARALTHYAASMDKVLEAIGTVLKRKGRAVIVVGNSKWNGRRVRPTKLLEELAKGRFRLIERFSYTTENRYMSYSRHNSANVNREYVVVLEKKS